MSNKTVVVFSHFDANNEIDEYVFYYLEKLKEISDHIVFVSECPKLRDRDIARSRTLVSNVIIERHREYDFGSFKRGFISLRQDGSLKGFDRLIFANDSVYGPLRSLGSIMAEMDKRPVDFWGMTYSNRGYVRQGADLREFTVPHLQCYFLVFIRNVFLSEAFQAFMYSVSPERDKFDVIFKYELGLTGYLSGHGFRYDSYVKRQRIERRAKVKRVFVRVVKRNLRVFCARGERLDCKFPGGANK